VFFDPSGLNVGSLLLLVLKLAYSAVANRFVAFAPIAKFLQQLTPKEVSNDLYSFFKIDINVVT
jgi:hypothetical protein